VRTGIASGLVSLFGSRPRKPTLDDRLIARRPARCVDGELAAGGAARSSEPHSARVEQLTVARTRRAVAHSLDCLIEQAEGPVSQFRITAIPCREQVWQAKAMICSTAARLRSAEPLDARGIARLSTLVYDTTGPCYVPSRTNALTVALRDIFKSLDVEG